MLARLKFKIDSLVNEILDRIPQDLIINGTVLDPSMGGGQFVKEVERRKRAAGKTDQEIRSTVFGVESNILRRNYAVNKWKLAGTYLVGNALKMDFDGMKFDVVVGNPPYNSNDTQRDNKAHRGQGDNLAKKFMLKSIELCTGHIAMIMPYGNTYSSSIAKYYHKSGLYNITRTKFESISQTVGIYFFNRQAVVDNVIDDFNIELAIPKNNIAKYYHIQPGCLNRQDYEHLTFDTGSYKIYITTAVIRYTDDIKLVTDLKDRTFGNWRVIVNTTASQDNIGKILIAEPTAYLSKSVNAFIVGNEQEAIKLQSYLSQPFVNKIMKQVKATSSNSAKYFKYIKSPFEE